MLLATGYEWTIARRYLAARNRDRFISVTAALSVAAIALGVAALIVVMAVMNGFRAELMDKILGYHGHILIQGYDNSISDYNSIIDDVQKVEGVVKVMPFTESQVMLIKSGRAWGAVVRGIPDSYFTPDKLNVAKVLDGKLEDAPKIGGIVVGSQIASRFGVGAGDELTIVSPNTISTPFGSTLRYISYPIAAVVEIGVYQFDETFVGMPLAEAQRFFRIGDTVSNIELFLDEPESVDTLGPVITAKVDNRAYVRTWRSFNQALVGALQTERVMMFIVVGLIIVVAVFNISSSMFMLVKDKASDIAILRTLGVTEAGIKRVFVTMGLTLGVLGIGIGCLLASLFIANIEAIKDGIEYAFGLNMWDPAVRFITSIRAEVDWFEAGLTIAIAILLSFIAAVIPARRAAKLNPVDILRYE